MLTLQTDANLNGIETALMQNDRPIVYASKSFLELQKDYKHMKKNSSQLYFGFKDFSHLYLTILMKPLIWIYLTLQCMIFKIEE